MGLQIIALLAQAVASQARPVSRPAPALAFQTLSQQAKDARDAKRLDEALTLYQRALNLRPAWQEGWWNAGSIAYDLDKYAECAADFQRLASLKPNLAPAWTFEGLCEYRQREFDNALKSLAQVERLEFQENPQLSQAARLHLALVLTRLGYFEKAIVQLYDLTSITRKASPEVVVAVGIAGLRKPWIPPEVPESERDKVLKLGEAMVTVMVGGDMQGAIQKFETALRDYPKEAEIHYRFGAFLLEQDPERGIQEIKKALELEPGNIPALLALARTYLKRNEPQTALPYAQEAVKLDPGNFAAHVGLGDCRLASGDAAGAARELEIAVSLAPKSPVAHYSLARAYAKLGRQADAAREREAFQQARKSLDSQ